MSAHTVLYVEDEEFDVMFMRKAFERAGIGQVLKVATDGQDAMDYLAGQGKYGDREKHPVPSMVLLDLHLPIVSGFEVLRWAREDSRLRTVPIVIFSSSPRPDDHSKAHQLGATDFVQKPSSATEFSKVVEHIKTQWLCPPPAAT